MYCIILGLVYTMTGSYHLFGKESPHVLMHSRSQNYSGLDNTINLVAIYYRLYIQTVVEVFSAIHSGASKQAVCARFLLFPSVALLASKVDLLVV